MIRQSIFIVVIIISFEVSAQKWDKEPDCPSDTLVVHPNAPMKRYADYDDSFDTQSSKVVQCKTRSMFGFRFEVAYSNYYYGEKTTNWIGRNGGLNFNFVFVVNKLNFGLRFKPQTLNPLIALDFNGTVLPTNAQLNNIRLDYYVGYSFDFNKLFSIEPYAGYNSTTFLVINEEELGKTYSFPRTGGFILGTAVNKYFRIGGYNYISIFGSFGYAFVDYKKVHPDLDNGYFEWNLGVAWKVFASKKINKTVE